MEKNINFKITEDFIETSTDSDFFTSDALAIIMHCYNVLVKAGMDIQDIADHSEAMLNIILENELDKNKPNDELEKGKLN